ncbi:MAG: YcjF family protein [Hoeflea sp.]|uniref:YcjF family protein n=1 Tax=Hoeflea sp. TaxID=1940281 RepID=UPI003EF90F3E
MTDNDPSSPPRKPRSFSFEESSVKEPTAQPDRQTRTSEKPRKPTAIPVTASITMEQEDPFASAPAALEALTPQPATPRRRRLTAGKVLMTSLGFLLALALGIWTDSLIRSLFERVPWLGWVASAVAAVAALALLTLVIKEILGIRRLARVAHLRMGIAAIAKSATAKEARALTAEVAALLTANPLTARGRKSLKTLDDEIIDGPHYLAFAERELMSPLDRQARLLTVNAAKRVSVVTAVSPRAFVDLAYVGFESVRLIRALAELYGGRPGTIGMIRLFRDVIAHLAVTGAIAAGDSLIQQVVGHGVAAKLSARLGEGVINGLMTARIGISAMDLCRPMPFSALKRPGIGDFMSDITKFAGDTEKNEANS